MLFRKGMLNLRELLKEQPEIIPGCVIDFMYFHLIGFDRNYSCIVREIDDKRIIGEVLSVNPPSLFDLSYRSFSKKRMKVNSVSETNMCAYESSDNVWNLRPLMLN